MTEPTATPSDRFSLPTDADTQRVTVSNWDPEVVPLTNVDALLQATPCVPKNYLYDPAPWVMDSDKPYKFIEQRSGPSDQNSTSEQPRRPTELYLRGVMYIWEPGQGSTLVGEAPKARYLGREIIPQAWEPGASSEGGTPPTCARFALDVDMLPDSQSDTSDTSLVFVPRNGAQYHVLILDASVRREPSSSTLSSTPTPTALNSSSKKSSSNAGKIVPAVLIPLLLLIAIAVGLFFWRKKRRERMAPSAAFRAQHPHGVSVAYATPPATAPLTAEGSELPTYAHSTGGSPGGSGPARYFPTQEKRPFLLNQTTS